MTEYDFLHENEVVVLALPQPRSCAGLWSTLLELGYSLHEDIFSFDRKERKPIWQAEAFVNVEIRLAGVELLLDRSEARQPNQFFDTVRLGYLLASLPRESMVFFIDQVFLLSDRLGIEPKYEGQFVTKNELQSQFEACADELAEAIGKPGSKAVTIFIESTYPR